MLKNQYNSDKLLRIAHKNEVITISRYLLKYKGKYRMKPNLDLLTNDFPRNEDNGIDSSYDDIYIKCANGVQIYHYGRSILVAYIPSLGRGHNILLGIAKRLNLVSEDENLRDYAKLYSILEKDKTVFNIVENDSEIEFKFNAKNIELIAEFLKPQTSGADISPFSTKNLPKEKYAISSDQIREYQEITKDLPQENKLLIGRITSDFINNIMAKDKVYKQIPIKSHMRQKMLKGREYIHSMGYWDKYLKYLRKNIC